MPLKLPTLDDRRYADLVEEARRLIPIYDPDWTNHNPSDPGITLLELFAWLTEMLLYRLDRVTDEHQRKFLKLLNGPNWTPSDNLNVDIRETLRAVRARDRAVTTADYERLATEGFNRWLILRRLAEQESKSLDEWWQVTRLEPTESTHLPSAVPLVARAFCRSSRNLEQSSGVDPEVDAPAHLSLIVLPRASDPQTKPEDLEIQLRALRRALWGWLDERRTLTTRHHVVGPTYAPISAELVIAAEAGAIPDNVASRVLDRLVAYLDPRTGGNGGGGWPFGRAVYVSEILEQIEAVEGVDYIADLMLNSSCHGGDEWCVAAEPLWHPRGDLIGLTLGAHNLPLPDLAVDRIVIAPASAFVWAVVTVSLEPNKEPNPNEVEEMIQIANAAIREFFHPLYEGPGPNTNLKTELLSENLQQKITAAVNTPNKRAQISLDLQGDQSRLLTENNGSVVFGLVTEPGELVNWRSSVQVTQAPS